MKWNDSYRFNSAKHRVVKIGHTLYNLHFGVPYAKLCLSSAPLSVISMHFPPLRCANEPRPLLAWTVVTFRQAFSWKTNKNQMSEVWNGTLWMLAHAGTHVGRCSHTRFFLHTHKKVTTQDGGSNFTSAGARRGEKETLRFCLSSHHLVYDAHLSSKTGLGGLYIDSLTL